jgi:hypothetical protein
MMVVSTSSPGPSGGGLAEIVGLILDRGVVIDAFVRVSLVGIEVLTIDARIVVASVDTYLRYAEAVGRVSLDTGKAGAPNLVEAGKAARPALEAGSNGLSDALGGVMGRPQPQPQRQEGER